MMLGQQFAAATRLSCSTHPISEKDTYISYLPAAHSFEQGLMACSMIYGCR